MRRQPSGFSASSSIIPTTGPISTFASATGAYTDFTGNGGSVANGGVPVHRPFVGNPPTSMNVDFGTGTTYSGGLPGANFIYGPFSATSAVNSPTGPWTILGTNIGFTLDGGQDSFSLNTFARIEPVPLPAALPLLAAGLGFMGFFARRRG